MELISEDHKKERFEFWNKSSKTLIITTRNRISSEMPAPILTLRISTRLKRWNKSSWLTINVKITDVRKIIAVIFQFLTRLNNVTFKNSRKNTTLSKAINRDLMSCWFCHEVFRTTSPIKPPDTYPMI